MLVAHCKMDMAGIEMRRNSELFLNRKLCASFIDPILLPSLAKTFIGRARTHVKTKSGNFVGPDSTSDSGEQEASLQNRIHLGFAEPDLRTKPDRTPVAEQKHQGALSHAESHM